METIMVAISSISTPSANPLALFVSFAECQLYTRRTRAVLAPTPTYITSFIVAYKSPPSQPSVPCCWIAPESSRAFVASTVIDFEVPMCSSVRSNAKDFLMSPRRVYMNPRIELSIQCSRRRSAVAPGLQTYAAGQRRDGCQLHA
ncbi:hypothetical protein C8R45DRAFT_1224691 [Mycena sanguinolenta]|nr:hypothetical protein C8R45DRAFT_1224691 [Mycena sanguinolenta]